MAEVTRGAARWLAAAMLVLGVAAPAQAAPDDVYIKAREAYGRGDVVAAMALLRPVADEGHAPSQSFLAYILDKADFDEEAVRYYRMAAAQGYAEGQYGLAGMLAAGQGAKVDAPEALRLLRAASEQGHPGATVALAQAYIAGLLGLDARQRNSAEAAAVLKRAADAGYRPAVTELVRAYREGAYGLAPDPAEAARWDARAKALAAAPAGKDKR
ncbi:MAG TPA: sel1 repeat family protein [Pelomicrobium sp.]|nr:sel1 repeat family protein [Pelomicrobium sp.]